MYPTLSIVIPNWNRREVLRDTLLALVADLPEWSEVLVVDNASRDGAPEMVRREFPRVGLIRLRRNLAAAARNVGLKYARGPLTLMLDNDSVPLPPAWERIEPKFQADPRLAALGATVLVQLAPRQYEAGGLPGVFVGCGVVFRTEALREVGGYPEDYGYYVEEYDVSCRLWRAGWRVRHFADVPIHHRKVQERRNMDRILRHLVRNNLKLWSRYCPPGHYWANQKETILRYHQVARLEQATAGYWRGLWEGLPELRRSGKPATPLTEPQYRHLFGLDRANQLLGEAIDRYGPGPVVVFGADKALPQVLALLHDAGLHTAALVDPRATRPSRSSGHLVLPLPQAESVASNWAVIGSLSPGNTRNLAAQASVAFREQPIAELCGYET